MTLSRVERALGMMRVYLVESSADDDWGDDRAEELAQTIRACLRQETDELRQKAPERNQKLPPDALRCAIRFVHDNLDSKLKWDEMAAPLGLDPFTFGRRFKLGTGMTPHQYVIRCRIRRAMRLLVRGELTLAEIALEVGCACQSHLTTLFRKHLGTTPGRFVSQQVKASSPLAKGRDVARKAPITKSKPSETYPKFRRAENAPDRGRPVHSVSNPISLVAKPSSFREHP